jgi:hypothetical protein
MKLSITRDQFETLDFQAKCNELSKTRGDYVYNLVTRGGNWYVDFGDGYEELVTFQRTIGDILTPVKQETYGAFCSECYTDTAHFHNNSRCADCGTPE